MIVRIFLLAVIGLLALSLVPQIGLLLLSLNLGLMVVIFVMRFRSVILPFNFVRKCQVPRKPMISIHVPIHDEPPEFVKRTLTILSAINYQNYEVIVIDTNTKDKAVWEPLEKHCAQLGEKFHFYHYMGIEGFKAGALNLALEFTNQKAELVAVVDADYNVMPDFINDAVGYFNDPKIGLVQFPQAYRNTSRTNKGLTREFEHFFFFYMNMGDYYDSVTSTGTLSIYRKSSILKIGGWQTKTITEDAELGLELLLNGYKTRYVNRIVGRGLMPDQMVEFKKQRSRWIIGNMQLLKNSFFRIFRSRNLSFGQKISIFTQLTAWFDFMFMLFLLLPWALILAMWNSSYESVMFLAGLNVSVYFISGLIIFLLGFWKKGCSIGDSLCAFLVHVGMSWDHSTAWLAVMFKKKFQFGRTNKFRNVATKQPMSRLVVISTLTICLLLFYCLFLGHYLFLVFFVNYFFLLFGYVFLKKQLISTRIISERLS
jgi:cellulose synthase/poly-beta-1,6-N-acetylglucosamine synthase-like glycosyltransferase